MKRKAFYLLVLMMAILCSVKAQKLPVFIRRF